MTKRTLLAALLSIGSAAATMSQTLLPMPKTLERQHGTFRVTVPPATDARLRVRWQPMPHAEEYALRITPDSILVTIADSAGYRHALRTLHQLAADGKSLPCLAVTDWPTCPWRSAMIDVSRHCFPIDFLKRQVEIMSWFKLNRLHLHLTDAGGWRMQLDRYPRLTSETAFRTQADWRQWWINGDRRYCHEGDSGAYGGYYTKDQLRSLVAYAAARGVTIVPEIEMPGHSEEVQAAYPELCCRTDNDSLNRAFLRSGDLCPGKEQTYEFLENVLEEVMDVFPSTYIHVGGDEANMTAWPQCDDCRRRLRALGATDVHALQSYLICRVDSFLRRHGRKLIAWDEVIADDMPAGITVQVWRKGDAARRAAAKGCDVILSPAYYCYLNNNQDAPGTTAGGNGNSYLPLRQVYQFCPQAMAADSTRLKGVEGCLWTEFVETPDEVEQMLYPRLLAIAETGWNGDPQASYDTFRERMLTWTRQLRQQGVNAFDLSHETGERKESLQPVAHLAKGCAVAYGKPYSRYYPAQGAVTLTDGQRGGWYFDDHRWQGFSGTGALDVTIDLGAVRRIRDISMTFLQDADAWIFLPTAFRISVSTDGRSFSTLADAAQPKCTDTGLVFRPFGWKGKARARFVRVEASPPGSADWLFTDEIVVR